MTFSSFSKQIRKRLPGTVMAVAILLLVCCAFAPAGERTTPPLRIVSLSPAITESLYLLGLHDSLAGVTTYCNRPEDAKNRERIGSVMEPNLEKIVKLRPDLVLAMDLTNRKSLKKMKDLGLNVVTFGIPYNFSRLCEVFLEIGRVTGRLDEARRLAGIARTRVDAIRRRTASLQKPKVLIQIGSKPFFVATKDFFINDYIDFAGAVNVFKDAPSGSVGREEAIMRNPDVIFVVTMGLSGQNERLAWKRFSSVRAVKTGRIYVLDSDEICSPTPLSFAKSLGDIAVLLHPDEAKGWK